MKPPTTTVVATVTCACQRDGQTVHVRVRQTFKGNQGEHSEPCWNCKRFAKVKVWGISNITGWVETMPGTNHFQAAMIDIEYTGQKY